MHKDAHDLEPLDEEWLMEVMPELATLEDDTLDALLGQSQRHSLYERGARELVLRERSRLEAEHRAEIVRLVRDNAAEREAELSQAEAESAGKVASHKYASELRMKVLEEEADEENESLRVDAEEKLREQEATIEEQRETIEGLEERLEAAAADAEAAQEKAEQETDAKLAELEERAVAEIDEMRAAADRGAAEADEARDRVVQMKRALAEAHVEVDLKRETSSKLKEEVIDNDRLTCANLNRIKTLEASLALERQGRDDLERLVEEQAEGMQEARLAAAAAQEAEHEVAGLRNELAEREAQLVALSRRLEAGGKPAAEERGSGSLRELNRRDSLLERLGGFGKTFGGSPSGLSL